jgi:hypothetical protein
MHSLSPSVPHQQHQMKGFRSHDKQRLACAEENTNFIPVLFIHGEHTSTRRSIFEGGDILLDELLYAVRLAARQLLHQSV